MLDLSGLNPPQREAVTHRGPPLLVLAGAGSGKTRVITYRIAHLIAGGVDPRHIAAVTFTNKAAAEMRARVGALVADRRAASRLTVSTFHSLGLSILKAEREALGYPRGFVIYDSADQLGVIREIMRTIHWGDRRFDVKAIQTRISLAKNRFIAPADYAANPDDDYDVMAAEIYPRYQAALRAFAAVDFDDLITEVVRLFRSHPEVAGRWRDKFRHLLVDEYQDTNRAQVHMIEALIGAGDNLCVVGDDDQSIYSWRGARPENILEFERQFPGARMVVLDQNYRSTPTILDAANAVIANNAERRGKTLWSSKARGEKIIAAIAPEADSEAQFVAREIEQLIRDGRRHRDVAVLYRSNIQTRPLEEALRLHQIPYVMIGGQQFFERKEVKDLIAYLRVALSRRDEISLRRIINYPARGIGAATMERLATESLARRTTLWRCVQLADQLELAPRQRHALNGFAALIDELTAALDEHGPVATARWLVEAIDLYEDLRAAAPSLEAAQRRIDNVESFLRSLERQQERSGGDHKALSDYLRQLSLETGDDRPEAGDRVTLTTLHGAKGLEFPVVFLIGAEEELLPHARTLVPRATDVVDDSGEAAVDISEERRLAYVGITRAEELLYVTRCATRVARGKRRPRIPSRFLLEIPEELLEVRDIADEQTQPVASDELASFFAQMAK